MEITSLKKMNSSADSKVLWDIFFPVLREWSLKKKSSKLALFQENWNTQFS